MTSNCCDTKNPASRRPDYSALLPKLFPNLSKLLPPEAYEEKYPPRKLAPGAMVTRFAPSPTGYMHIGGIYASLINLKLSQQTQGVFFLRVEDTDIKRAIPGALETIVDGMAHHGVSPHEGLCRGADGSLREIGAYGPYSQTSRKEIYQSYTVALLKRGLAYPCFLTPEEIEAIRHKQEALKEKPGIYGRWSPFRDAPPEKITENLAAGKPFVIRLRSYGDVNKTISWNDGIRGLISTPESDLDIVLLKGDGFPLYHLAHVVDDYLMRTTDVIRADEWLSSTPLHLQLFGVFGWPVPRYAHIAPIDKIDPGYGGEGVESRRKLSKRHDPEANVEFYKSEGYPPQAIVEYLMNLANSRFEDWRVANPSADLRSFELKLSEMNNAGALLDLVKLKSVSQETLSRMDLAALCREAMAWLKQYEPVLYDHMLKDENKAHAILAIERRREKPCKRWTSWRDLRAQIVPFFDDLAPALNPADFPQNVPPGDRKRILEALMASWREDLGPEAFFELLKTITRELGYAEKPKDFKKEPGRYTGHLGDVAMVIRVAVFHSQQSPDLSEVLKVMGRPMLEARCRAAISAG